MSERKVGCERWDGLLVLHDESETCEVCGPSPQPSGDTRRCLRCRAVVDDPESEDGLTDGACEIDGRWSCSRECWERIADMLDEDDPRRPLREARHALLRERPLTETATDRLRELTRIIAPEWTAASRDTGSEPQPCGHPRSDIVSTDEGTSYCRGCEREARERFTGSEEREAAGLEGIDHTAPLGQLLHWLVNGHHQVKARIAKLEEVAHEPASIPIGNIMARLEALESAPPPTKPSGGEEGYTAGLLSALEGVIGDLSWCEHRHTDKPPYDDEHRKVSIRDSRGAVEQAINLIRSRLRASHPSGEGETTEADEWLDGRTRMALDHLAGAIAYHKNDPGIVPVGCSQCRDHNLTVGDLRVLHETFPAPSPPSEPEGEIMWLNREPCQGRHAEPMYAVIEDDWIQDGMEHLRAEPGWERVRVIPTPPSTPEEG